MAAKLKLVGSSQPSKELVENALRLHVLDEVYQFAMELAYARAMFREHPELVTGQDWDPVWVESFRDNVPYHPNEEEAAAVPDLEMLRRKLLPQAEKTARFWANRDAASQDDTSFLQRLGIAG